MSTLYRAEAQWAALVEKPVTLEVSDGITREVKPIHHVTWSTTLTSNGFYIHGAVAFAEDSDNVTIMAVYHPDEHLNVPAWCPLPPTGWDQWVRDLASAKAVAS